MMAPGVVPKLGSTPGRVRRSARWTLGADNESVLGEFGIDADAVARLAEQGVV
jgi:crotonobetainyl-CoA:carnitine CoA-transferase CaiB-like acyl-CoA transferase